MENRVKILIADGNEEFCGHVKRRLEQVPGYEIVGTAADGQRAVELMRVTKPDILVNYSISFMQYFPETSRCPST